MRFSSLLLLGLVATGAGMSLHPLSAENSPESLGDGPLHILPFGLMDHVRELDHVVPLQVQAYNSGSGVVHLIALEARRVDGLVLDRSELMQQKLVGDGGQLLGVHRLLETLPVDVSHRRSNRMFLAEDQIPRLDPAIEAERVAEISGMVAQLRRSGMPQARNLDFHLDLKRLFPVNTQAGDEVVLDLVLSYLDASGTVQELTHSHMIKLLPVHLPPPAEWFAANQSPAGAASFVAGDLHVHNCRDQATSGCPNCAAESFNITGSFTNQQLRDQFRALGYDWFSSTTHSYCIDNVGEFDLVINESDSLDLPDFVVIASTEMTNREEGPQWGSDIFDATCFLGGQFSRGIAHMGGHHITSSKPGGQDYFLGACDGPIHNQDTNVKAANQEGGFAIANHPGGDVISFNSIVDFEGMERGRTTGTEIWNYDVSTGRASVVHKQWWVNRLLEGKITYPFSGSDTHDAALEFGAAITYISGALSDDSVVAALKKGKTYLSNGPFLYNNLTDQGGRTLIMGDIFVTQQGNIPPNYPVTLESYYNLGADVATMRVYRGVVGDNSETLVAEYLGVSGSGVMNTATTVAQNDTSWYRTELEVDGQPRSAYATPCYIYLQ